MEYKTDKLRPTQPFLVLETQDFKQEIYLNQGISHFYTFRLEKTKEITTVPDSCVDMLFEYGENGMTAYAIGSPIKALDVEWQGKKEYFGVRFMPGSMPVGLNVTLRDLVECRFYLEDDLLAWNNGYFTYLFDNGKCIETEQQPDYEVSMSIGTLTTLMLGYKTAEKLHVMDKIQASDEAVEHLDDILFHRIPYVSDYI